MTNYQSKSSIVGFDPGKDKCGVAVMTQEQQLLYHQVVAAESAIATIQNLIPQFGVNLVVIGNQTTAKQWLKRLQEQLPPSIPIEMVNERNSTLEARDRYWQMYPPQGLQKLIPQGMRLPPRPIDDLVAILLIERYLKS